MSSTSEHHADPTSFTIRGPSKLTRTRGVCEFILLALYLVLEAFGITSSGGDLGLHLLARHFRRHFFDGICPIGGLGGRNVNPGEKVVRSQLRSFSMRTLASTERPSKRGGTEPAMTRVVDGEPGEGSSVPLE